MTEKQAPLAFLKQSSSVPACWQHKGHAASPRELQSWAPYPLDTAQHWWEGQSKRGAEPKSQGCTPLERKMLKISQVLKVRVSSTTAKMCNFIE